MELPAQTKDQGLPRLELPAPNRPGAADAMNVLDSGILPGVHGRAAGMACRTKLGPPSAATPLSSAMLGWDAMRFQRTMAIYNGHAKACGFSYELSK